MLEGDGEGGEGRGKRQRNSSQRQCRGWERKGERKRPVGIHLLGEWEKGVSFYPPTACPLQMSITDLSKLVNL